MKYELNPLTSDCYDGTSCLINKLNIKDEKIPDQIEADITFAKTAELESIPINEIKTLCDKTFDRIKLF